MRFRKNTETTISGPVFYDAKGKRWHRVMESLLIMTIVIAAATYWAAPQALAPLWKESLHQGNGFPRQLAHSSELKDIPILGTGDGEVLTRIVRVERDGDTVNLIDPFTGNVLRTAQPGEDEEIGNSKYALDHFGQPADHQLMLTFDDGPSARYTPEILDVLAKEHVPATFFMVGANIAKNLDVFKRVIREGHMVGNHTLFHIDFDKHSDIRNREELIATDRIMRAGANYSSRLFRMPYGDPDKNALAMLQSQQLGYIHVDFDLDTKDWSYPPEADIPVPPLDGKGHVVLMHDGGGDRSSTAILLEKFIQEAKRKGYTFSTIAPLLPEGYVPTHGVAPTTADQTTLRTVQVFWVIPNKMLGWLFWFGVGSLSIMSVLYLTLALANNRRQRKRNWVKTLDHYMPHISVVMAAYNEEKVIRKTLNTLRASNYPQSRLEVVVVNDGSKDGTQKVLDDYARKWPQLKVVHQPNAGKSFAINNGISHARPESKIIVTLDADTLFEPQTIRLLVRHFVKKSHRQDSKPVGAVAGHVKVGNRRNIITAWQSLEYISGICVTRLAEGAMGAIAIVPGACSAWSRRALEQIGGLSEDTLAEDADATLQLHQLGYSVLQENTAVAYTEAPESIRTLAKQRLRWTYGNVQVLWKHRSMLMRPKYGMLGMIALPYALLSLIVPLIFLPSTVIAAVIGLANGNWHSVVLFAVFVMTLHMVISIVAIVVARERAWHLLIVPIYRLIYEPLRAYLLYASLLRILRGTAAKWNKLERLNSAALQSRSKLQVAS